jgi:hypothetical protein
LKQVIQNYASGTILEEISAGSAEWLQFNLLEILSYALRCTITIFLEIARINDRG